MAIVSALSSSRRLLRICLFVGIELHGAQLGDGAIHNVARFPQV